MAENKATQNPILAKAVSAFLVEFYVVDSKGNYSPSRFLDRAFDSQNKAKAYGLLVTLNAQHEDGSGCYFKVTEKLIEDGSINFPYQDGFIDYELSVRSSYIEGLYQDLSTLTEKARKNPNEENAQNLLNLEKAIRKSIENYAKAVCLLEKHAKNA